MASQGIAGTQGAVKRDRWLDYWHGIPDIPDCRYLRCEGCRHLVTWHQIHRGGCRCLEGKKLRPARLTVWELIKVNFLPWTVR